MHGTFSSRQPLSAARRQGTSTDDANSLISLINTFMSDTDFGRIWTSNTALKCR